MKKGKKVISIVVCTYNRAEILQNCLASLVNQTISLEEFDIIVVDNNSTDHTKELVESYAKSHQNIRYYLEKKQGLSYSRNVGYDLADSEWIGYLDDDAKATSEYISTALSTIKNYDFDCFGGPYYAWFSKLRPYWLPEDFGTKEIEGDAVARIYAPEISGGNMFFKMAVLETFNGFRTDLGMNGESIGYGEETELQLRLLEAGKKIGYVPSLSILHLVNERKLHISWHLKASYAHGRKKAYMEKFQSNRFKFVIKEAIDFPFKILPFLVKGLIKREFRLYLFKYGRPVFFRWGLFLNSK